MEKIRIERVFGGRVYTLLVNPRQTKCYECNRPFEMVKLTDNNNAFIKCPIHPKGIIAEIVESREM
jgi:hypothetical protein